MGLLLAAYEMNAFKSDYQKAVISNAKAFARALKDQGLMVEGDPRVGYTETHQVIVRVGYGKGPLIAERLEENNIIVNYQGAPDDEAFTTASCLRMGVQEMTRFGMREEDFVHLAEVHGSGHPERPPHGQRGVSIQKEIHRDEILFARGRGSLPGRRTLGSYSVIKVNKQSLIYGWIQISECTNVHSKIAFKVYEQILAGLFHLLVRDSRIAGSEPIFIY